MLDLGCGVGRHVVPLARASLRVVGGDLSPSGLAACAARLDAEDLPALLVHHRMDHPPFASTSFDGVLAFNVIYHTTLAGLRRIRAQIYRILRPGGLLYLTFLGRVDENIARCRADVTRGICREVEPFTFIYLREAHGDKYLPHHYCDEDEVRDLLADFELEEILPVRSEYTDEDDIHWVSLHYHVRAHRPGG